MRLENFPSQNPPTVFTDDPHDLLGTISGLRFLVSRRTSLSCLREALPPIAPFRSPVWDPSRDLDHFYRSARAACLARLSQLSLEIRDFVSRGARKAAS
jgi:hypothetical protein